MPLRNLVFCRAFKCMRWSICKTSTQTDAVTAVNAPSALGNNAETNPIKKNKKGKISVTYDTKRVGEFVKTITVTSDHDPRLQL